MRCAPRPKQHFKPYFVVSKDGKMTLHFHFIISKVKYIYTPFCALQCWRKNKTKCQTVTEITLFGTDMVSKVYSARKYCQKYRSPTDS